MLGGYKAIKVKSYGFTSVSVIQALAFSNILMLALFKRLIHPKLM
jgi:hypothetical protein